MNQPCFSYLFLHIVYLPGQMTSVIAGLSPSHFEPTQCHSTGDGATPSSESLVILGIEEWESLTFKITQPSNAPPFNGAFYHCNTPKGLCSILQILPTACQFFLPGYFSTIY